MVDITAWAHGTVNAHHRSGLAERDAVRCPLQTDRANPRHQSSMRRPTGTTVESVAARCLTSSASRAPPSRKSLTRAWPIRACTISSTRGCFAASAVAPAPSPRSIMASRSIAPSRTSPWASSPTWTSTVVVGTTGAPSQAPAPRGSTAVSASIRTPSAAQAASRRLSVPSKNIHGSASASRSAGWMKTCGPNARTAVASRARPARIAAYAPMEAPMVTSRVGCSAASSARTTSRTASKESKVLALPLAPLCARRYQACDVSLA
mmetsp:Transcript_40165/g.110618  ORF Transcript_40165/g.110618 Transcript_40165/m.110618 type:complete len:264 (-) Transcript_40165:709-1500(-)